MKATRENYEAGFQVTARELPVAHGKSDWLEVRAHEACQEKWPGLDYVLVLWLDDQNSGKVVILENESEPGFDGDLLPAGEDLLDTWEYNQRQG